MKITIPELEDLPWFPSKLRQMQMEFIGFMVVLLRVYHPLTPIIKQSLAKSNTRNILDLCAGSGEPIRNLVESEKIADLVILSDLYPHPKFEKAGITWNPDPINALEMNHKLLGMRTMFNAYHHFNEEEKLKLLEYHSPSGIFIAEILQPNILELMKIIVTTIIGQLLFTPFIKPFSFQRLVFTYLIPINLFTITWDGIISVLKSQRSRNMFKLIDENFKSAYQFDCGVSGPFWARVTWIYLKKHS